MVNYSTPGVYVEEISKFPPSVVQASTAIPAFIGFTEKGPNEPTRVSSMVDYEETFGGPAKEIPDFQLNPSTGEINSNEISLTPKNKMYYMLRMYFENGGGPCYIVSAGNYKENRVPADIDIGKLSGALEKLEKEDEPTLIIFTDGHNDSGYYSMLDKALLHCGKTINRFLIGDVVFNTNTKQSAESFRLGVGVNDLSYGAVYYPDLRTNLTYFFNEDEVSVTVDSSSTVYFLRISEEAILKDANLKNQSLYHQQEFRQAYYDILEKINSVKLVLPPSAAIAGIYARVDNDRGVWKAPANVSVNRVVRPDFLISDEEQENLNIDSTGKSINVIRRFKGKGNLVWGARTLDGSSNEWKYISVRRFFNMVEKSCKDTAFQFVFEPNDANTWAKVKAMIENFLILQWRAGALMGAKPEDAFFVKIGLGETMTEDDITNGKLIVEIGMSVVRPAEFIILRFSHKMIEA